MRIGAFLRLLLLRILDQNVGSSPEFGIGDRIDPDKLEHRPAVVPPDLFNLAGTRFAIRQLEHHFLQLLRASRLRRINLACQLSSIPTRPEQAADRDHLFQNLQRKPPVQLHSSRAKQCPDGPRGPPLLADHFPQIGGRDAQFQNRHLFAGNLTNRNFIWNVHQRFRDFRHQILSPVILLL